MYYIIGQKNFFYYNVNYNKIIIDTIFLNIKKFSGIFF